MLLALNVQLLLALPRVDDEVVYLAHKPRVRLHRGCMLPTKKM